MPTFSEINVPGRYASANINGVVTTTVVVAAIAGQRTRVMGLCLVAAVAGTVQVQDTASNALTGVMAVAVGVPIVLPISEAPWAESALGAGIQIVATGTSQSVSGVLTYIQG